MIKTYENKMRLWFQFVNTVNWNKYFIKILRILGIITIDRTVRIVYLEWLILYNHIICKCVCISWDYYWFMCKFNNSFNYFITILIAAAVYIYWLFTCYFK